MHTPETSGNLPSIKDFDVSIETISKLARLGMVFDGTHVVHADGRDIPNIRFSFLPDTPLGRANAACGTDQIECLEDILDEAEALPYDIFARMYYQFGPYES